MSMSAVGTGTHEEEADIEGQESEQGKGVK